MSEEETRLLDNILRDLIEAEDWEQKEGLNEQGAYAFHRAQEIVKWHFERYRGGR